MRTHDILAVLGIAAATTACTVALLAPRGLGAADASQAITPLIAQPRLVAQGCEFVLKTDRPAYEAGAQPEIQITAINTTDKSVEAAVWVNVLASSPASPMARMLPVPRSLWSHKHVVSLGPGEAKTAAVRCECKLPAGQSVSITLSDKDSAVLAGKLPVQQRRDSGNQTSLPVQAGRRGP